MFVSYSEVARRLRREVYAELVDQLIPSTDQQVLISPVGQSYKVSCTMHYRCGHNYQLTISAHPDQFIADLCVVSFSYIQPMDEESQEPIQDDRRNYEPSFFVAFISMNYNFSGFLYHKSNLAKGCPSCELGDGPSLSVLFYPGALPLFSKN
jgi:hypothetical protein